MSEILSVKNLKLNYGPIAAIKGIDLTVGEGQIVAILGANGAGKTSTLKVISGLLKPKDGEIIFDGKNIAGKPAHKIAQLGIMQSPEGRFVLTGLTVEENLRVGGYNIKSKDELARNFERVYTLFPRLKERAKQQSSTLSGGEQQMLAIGRALMGSPKLLILDEPSLGLAPLLIKDIFNTLLKIKKEGTTILIVEQNALSTLKIADYAYVLELGKISMHGKASELIKDERLIAAYLGGK
ncbi:MAG: ABC transporter ATP-binding protein [Clostridia bacterium]|nr:ABC transporter ATP-binding protein [Clostridia bacterium]